MSEELARDLIDAYDAWTVQRVRSKRAKQDLVAAVAKARDAGVSLEAIGKELGISRQAVHQLLGSQGRKRSERSG